MRSRGFSLIELMVTIAIVAILAAIAFPSFQSSLRSNRLATTTNEMLASVALARSEAIRSTRGGGICASTDGSTCGAAATWNDGWLVWSDNGDDSAGFGSFDASIDTVVRVVDGHPRMQMDGTDSDGSAILSIGFDRRGRPLSAVATPVSLRVQPEGCPASLDLVRTLVLNPVGQVVNQRGVCE